MKKAKGEGEGKVSVQVFQRNVPNHLFSFNRFNFGTRHFPETIRGNRGCDLHAASLSKESRAKFEKRRLGRAWKADRRAAGE